MVSSNFITRSFFTNPLEHGNTIVIVYLDQELKTKEEKDYLVCTDGCPEKFSIEKRYQNRLLCNHCNAYQHRQITGKTYISHKSRDAVKKLLGTFKKYN